MHPGTGTKVQYSIALMTSTPGNTGKEYLLDGRAEVQQCSSVGRDACC